MAKKLPFVILFGYIWLYTIVLEMCEGFAAYWGFPQPFSGKHDAPLQKTLCYKNLIFLTCERFRWYFVLIICARNTTVFTNSPRGIPAKFYHNKTTTVNITKNNMKAQDKKWVTFFFLKNLYVILSKVVMGRASGSARARPVLDFFRASRARLFWKGLGPSPARARGQYPGVPVKGPRHDNLL